MIEMLICILGTLKEAGQLSSHMNVSFSSLHLWSVSLCLLFHLSR